MINNNLVPGSYLLSDGDIINIAGNQFVFQKDNELSKLNELSIKGTVKGNRLGKLIVHNSRMEKEQIHFIVDSVSIGRDSSCTICIPCEHVSRLHAVLMVDSSRRVILNHLSKTNSTLLNGVAVASIHNLENGDKLIIGDRTIIFNAVRSDETEEHSADTSRRPQKIISANNNENQKLIITDRENIDKDCYEEDNEFGYCGTKDFSIEQSSPIRKINEILNRMSTVAPTTASQVRKKVESSKSRYIVSFPDRIVVWNQSIRQKHRFDSTDDEVERSVSRAPTFKIFPTIDDSKGEFFRRPTMKIFEQIYEETEFDQVENLNDVNENDNIRAEDIEPFMVIDVEEDENTDTTPDFQEPSNEEQKLNIHQETNVFPSPHNQRLTMTSSDISRRVSWTNTVYDDIIREDRTNHGYDEFSVYHEAQSNISENEAADSNIVNNNEEQKLNIHQETNVFPSPRNQRLTMTTSDISRRVSWTNTVYDDIIREDRTNHGYDEFSVYHEAQSNISENEAADSNIVNNIEKSPPRKSLFACLFGGLGCMNIDSDVNIHD